MSCQVDPAYGAEGWAGVERVVAHMRREWGILAVTDLVLNHTAVDSTWIKVTFLLFFETSLKF